ncbi:uncharacterized protein LOC126847196 [Adelges cooleyi]|uniref:uncharacterized protein LOC126847196 n=1 Tax=Adelges cooleyi TaxID=133065 RepID=UPI00217F4C2C|nr:uncharacterized protein LOC126847196 [Adelges cooleyi]
MKLFCFLFTFILVSVSANDDDDETYKKIVFLTNAAIEQAFNKNDLIVGNNSRANGLEYIIEKIVNDEGSPNRNFAKINLMITAPDQVDLANIVTALARFFPPTVYAAQYQLNIRKEIKETLGIAISDALYHEDSEGLNLTTLAEQRRRRVITSLKNIFRRKLGPKYDQFMMQLKLEVRNTLNNEVSEDLGRLNLTTLAEERRVTGTSIENTIRRGVLGTDTSEVVEETNGSVHDVFLWGLCRLIGLYISAQFPRSYIRELWIDPDNNTCNMHDGTIERRFKKINDVWWQLCPIVRETV